MTFFLMKGRQITVDETDMPFRMGTRGDGIGYFMALGSNPDSNRMSGDYSSRCLKAYV